MRRAVSWIEIASGLALLALSASLMINDWLQDVYCADPDLECSSWAVLLAGVFLGVPTLLVGLTTRMFLRTFWYGQTVQVLLLGYVAALAVFG